ncbi:hypothetical protein BC827DRAFT_724991 [Russula dissimulans]|jgi:hypothetical protein|nr:hypothetical protein BC827DRAFT_724991 [Russula dissimulans]
MCDIQSPRVSPRSPELIECSFGIGQSCRIPIVALGALLKGIRLLFDRTLRSWLRLVCHPLASHEPPCRVRMRQFGSKKDKNNEFETDIQCCPRGTRPPTSEGSHFDGPIHFHETMSDHECPTRTRFTGHAPRSRCSPIQRASVDTRLFLR